MTSKDLSSDPIRAVTCDRLRWLSVGNYVHGAVKIATFSIFLFHFFILIAISFIPNAEWSNFDDSGLEDELQESETMVEVEGPPEVDESAGPADSAMPVAIMFRVFAAFLGLIVLGGWIWGGLTIYAGRCIARREKRTLVLIMAGLNCISIPYGSLLGIATFLTLSTPDAKKEYGIAFPEGGTQE